MKKTLLVRLAVLLLITATMSGCLWVVDDEGHGGGGGGHRGGGHGEGEHRGDRH